MLQDQYLENAFVANKDHFYFGNHSNLGNMLAIGLPGSGKTSGNRTIAEFLFKLKCKVICLYDAGRLDLSYFAFPSNSPFWSAPKIEENYGRKSVYWKRSFPTELLYPVCQSIPKRIPVNGIPFTIAPTQLNEDDLYALLGYQVSATTKEMWSYIHNKINKHTTGSELINLMSKAIERSADRIKLSVHGARALKYGIIQPMITEGFIAPETAPTTINLKNIITNKNVITSLVLKHFPQKYWGFLVHWFINHCYELLAGVGRTKRIKQRTYLVMSEVADLLRGDAGQNDSSAAITRMIARILKQFRGPQLFFLMDTQLPQELPEVRNAMSTIFVYKSGFNEVKKVLELSGFRTDTGSITQKQINIIPLLPPGYCCVFDRNSGKSKIIKMRWCRSRTYEAGDDFYEIYNQVYGKAQYQDITSILERNKQIENESINLINKERARRKAMFKLSRMDNKEKIMKLPDSLTIQDVLKSL